jgi:hypothetical protein
MVEMVHQKAVPGEKVAVRSTWPVGLEGGAEDEEGESGGENLTMSVVKIVCGV